MEKQSKDSFYDKLYNYNKYYEIQVCRIMSNYVEIFGFFCAVFLWTVYGENVSNGGKLFMLKGKWNKGDDHIMNDRKLLGKIGEDLAVSMLYAEGYAILDRNFRSHFGEIDIICEKGGVMYFVEVKTRTCDVFGEPDEAVNEIKQYRMKKTAEYYLLVKKIDADVTFKVIEVMIRETDDSLISLWQ